MDNNSDKIIRGITLIIAGILLTAFPSMIKSLGTTENTEINMLLEQIYFFSKVVVKSFGFICVMSGVISTVKGVVEEAVGISAYDNQTNTLIFRILDGKKSKTISVGIGKLSSDTRLILRKRIETPLQKLYEVAYKGKRAKEEYRMCKEYIIYIAQDLDNAIKQCENELMEKKIIEKLYIIENAIENITDKVANAILTDKDEERFLKELQVETFEPFSLTDNMNKLH